MQHFPDELRLDAYHDGELSPADRAEVELLLADSPSGIQYLAELARMSAWLATEAGASAARLSPMSRARLHKRVDAVMEPLLLEERLVRFGWELSGVAAAVLLVGSAWLMSATANPAAAAAAAAAAATGATVPPWVGAQVATVADPIAQQPATPAAAWYLADSTPRD